MANLIHMLMPIVLVTIQSQQATPSSTTEP